VGEALRKMFTLAVEWEWRADNPAQGFHRRLEHARERFLIVAMKRIASNTSRTRVVRGLPVVLCAGSRGWIIAHSASVKSLAYLSPARSC